MKHRRVLLGLIGLLACMLPPHPAQAAGPLVVTTTAATIAVNGQCSLREAIRNANNDAATAPDCPAGSGADTIVLAPGATYTLEQSDNLSDGATGLPSITSTITISGNGATIQRTPVAATPPFRLFHVGATGALTLADLTLAGGFARGIDNVQQGATGAGAGGALYNAAGAVQLVRTRLVANRALGGAGSYGLPLQPYGCANGAGCGGALYNGQGTMMIVDSELYDNRSEGGNDTASAPGISNATYICGTGAGCGGALYNAAGVLTVTTSILHDNRSDGRDSSSTADQNLLQGGFAWGGGLATGGGEVALIASSILSNTAQGGDGSLGTAQGNGGAAFGGGIAYVADTGQLILTTTLVAANHTAGGHAGPSATSQGLAFGGGIWSCSPSGGNALTGLRLVQSTISANEATAPQQRYGGYAAAGGGILHECGMLVVVASTIDHNTTPGEGGGLSVAGFADGSELRLINSTVSANRSMDTGGGMYIADVHAILLNSTITANSAAGTGGGIGLGTRATLAPRATIIASNAGGDCAGGQHDSGGDNLDGDGSCGLDGPGDQPKSDPRLGPLQDNGGPTLTHALLAGSPAIDGGKREGCVDPFVGLPITVDQRGVTRPQGSTCDIGAYEMLVADLQLSLAPADPLSARPGQIISATLHYTNTGPGSVPGVVLRQVLPVELTLLGIQSSVPITPTDASSVTWQLGDLAAGASAAITITMRVSPTASAAQIISATAAISSPFLIDADLHNDTAILRVVVTNGSPAARRQVFVPLLAHGPPSSSAHT